MAYTQEQKERVVKRLLPPNNERLHKVSKEENIPVQTVYTWYKKSSQKTELKRKKPEITTAEDRIRIVAKTEFMNAEQLSMYCREQGLFPEEVALWRKACLNQLKERNPDPHGNVKDENKRIKQLEKELREKEKALAEAAALLVLRKKLQAFYGEGNEED